MSGPLTARREPMTRWTKLDSRRMKFTGTKMMLAGVFSVGILVSTAPAPSAQTAAPAQPSAPAGRSAPVWQGSQLNRLSQRAEMYYQGAWGVDELHVKVAESGQIIRFNYRVLDPQKATVLNDKKAEPELFDPQGGVKLVVPQLEKVGKLRQSSTPKPGMTYWMAFSNPTLAVKGGHRGDVFFGHFA